MNNFSRIVFAGLISLSIAGAGFAADTSKPAAPSTKAAATEHRYRGSVTALDAKAGTLKVKGKSDEKSFVVTDKARSSFDKVKVGDRVRLTYVDENGKLMISSVAESKSGSDSKASK